MTVVEGAGGGSLVVMTADCVVGLGRLRKAAGKKATALVVVAVTVAVLLVLVLLLVCNGTTLDGGGK